MVQPKYNPEEALERVKLMMKYDLSKTLTENKTLVLEQTTTLTIDDIKNGKSVVKSGMKGSIVGKIQELLISAGYKNISKSGEVDNDFGSLTKGQVEKFQSENTNDKGEPLQKDGKVGIETIKALLKKSDVKMRTAASGVKSNKLAPKEFGEIPKTTQPVSQQTQTATQQTQATPDPFFCVKNYYAIKKIPFDSDEGVKIDGNKFIRVNLDKNKSWYFIQSDKEGGMWIEFTSQEPKYNEGKGGKWKCDGFSNFIIEKNDGSIFKSLNPSEGQTQTVTQQTQTQPASQQNDTELRRGKERLLQQPLKDDSVNILNCRRQIDDLFAAWTNRNSSTDRVKAGVPATRDIVQACYDQHQGKRLLGRDANRKLTILSGRDPNVGGPSENGRTAIYRIKGK